MIRIQQLKLAPSHKKEELESGIAKTLKINKNDIISYVIVKKSIDARHKNDIKFVYTIDVELKNERKIVKRVNNNNVMLIKQDSYEEPKEGTLNLESRPVIVGMGPAGLFAGLFLAKKGYFPILLERGEEVKNRTKSVLKFWESGELNISSNVQFGEGGAGTFSDGKLNTLVKDPMGRNRKVLETFIEAGAPSEILYINKPHIGTDILSQVVENIRNQIIDLGGEVRFLSQVTDIEIKAGEVKSVVINNKEKIDTKILILAIGHSARDTFSMLEKNMVPMIKKAFAVGVRIEHPQSFINLSQYGKENDPYLPVADYKVAKTVSTNRNVYSFCMCPGGYVVNASSEEKMLAVNGMSYHKRDSVNANSAIVVNVNPEDFGSEHVLAGVEFQRKLERKAYMLGNGKIPMQLFGDFLENRDSKCFGEVAPCTKGEHGFGNLRELFPEFISLSLMEGIRKFDHMISGFGRYDAVLSGVESRTSSPVRILRDTELESEIKGLYPCGEGAGYAGGITSAAMDGIKISEAIISKYKSLKR